jgi:hypothetical protein
MAEAIGWIPDVVICMIRLLGAVAQGHRGPSALLWWKVTRENQSQSGK